MKWYHDWASTGILVIVLVSRAGGASSAVVEASALSNVFVTASLWDLRGEDEGGCGLAGCDPRLTRDGNDNTVADSRWSCEPSIAAFSYDGVCSIQYELDDDFTISHVVIYFHESDDATNVAIPFTVFAGSEEVSAVTSPGTALGTGQKVTLPAGTSHYIFSIGFTLTTDQWIGVSEVEIFLDDTGTDDVIIPTLETLTVVNAKEVTNVVASASWWDLRSDAGCGLAGCDPRLATDGDDNTVAASRWSCTAEDDYIWQESNFGHRCFMFFHLDSIYTISYVVIYMHESDDDTKSAVAIDVHTCTGDECKVQVWYQPGIFVATPGTALGAGQRLNLPRPEAQGITIHPNLTANQWIDISEVEIFVEVAETNVPVAAAEAWTDVTAETLSPVSASASESMPGFGPELTTDGDDNTVASSHWSCNATVNTEFCALYFEFNDQYTISHLMIYVPDSGNATKTPLALTVEFYEEGFYGGYYHPAGDYETKPGTPLGEGERINLIRPTASLIGIFYYGLEGATAEVSEVEVYFEVRDSSPTPAPFVPSSDTDVETSAYGTIVYNDDGLYGAASTTAPRSTSGDDDVTYFGGIGDETPSPASSDERGDGSAGTSSSSALNQESTSSRTTNISLGWMFTVIAVGAMSSVLRRATVLLGA